MTAFVLVFAPVFTALFGVLFAAFIAFLPPGRQVQRVDHARRSAQHAYTDRATARQRAHLTRAPVARPVKA